MSNLRVGILKSQMAPAFTISDILSADLRMTIALHYITLHHITLHHITLHHITLHYITLHYITLHYILSAD